MPALSGDLTGLAAALYVAFSYTGALSFGCLTDRFGRKKLFMVTLGVYLVATAMTALSFAPWWFPVPVRHRARHRRRVRGDQRTHPQQAPRPGGSREQRLASILTTFFHVDAGHTGYYAIIAVGNFFGPLLLGPLFDTVGGKPRISGTYLLSGILLFGMG